MSLFEFVWDADQESQISDLKKRVEELERQNKLLYEWVLFFAKRMNVEIPNETK